MKNVRTERTNRKNVLRALPSLATKERGAKGSTGAAAVSPSESRAAEDSARILAETSALTVRFGSAIDDDGGYSGKASVGDIVRHTYDAGNREYSSDDPGAFLRDALLAAADDFRILEAAILYDGDMHDALARFTFRAEARVRAAVELDHRLQLGLAGQVTP